MNNNESKDDKRITGSSTIRAGSWYMVSNLFVKGIAFLTTPIFTRILSRDDIGSYSNLVSWIGILSVIITLDLSASIYLAVFEYKNRLDKYVSSILTLSSITSFLAYLLALIFKDYCLKLFNIEEYMLHVMFFYIIFYPAINMFNIANRTRGKYKSTVIFSLLTCILSNLFAIILVFYYQSGISGRVYGTYLPQICINLVLYFYVLRKGKGFEIRYWLYALSLSLPLIFHDLAHIVLSASDRIMITKISSTSDTALYSIAYSCGSIVSIVWLSMNNAWSPWAYERMQRNDLLTLRRTVKVYTFIFLSIVLIAILLSPEILWILGGQNYMNSVHMIPVVMVSYVFMFVYSLYANIQFFHKKQRSIAFGTILAAILNVSLNYVLIGKFGYTAAAYTTLIGYIFLVIYNYAMTRRIGKHIYYETFFFIKMLIISIFSIPVIQFLYNFFILRYMLMIVIFMVFIFISLKKKEKIKEAIRTRSIIGLIKAYNDK